jgi:hypothetical protein
MSGNSKNESEPFELIRVSDIEESETEEWLVTDLWAASGVGIIGGEPKSCKTWLGLDIALSVASGTDIQTVRELGGWASLAVVERYVRSSDHLKRAAVERLSKLAS